MLIAAITRHPVFGIGMFTLLMVENLPISRVVEPYFKARIEHFPPFLKRILLQLQGYNPLNTTVTGVKREINFNTQLRKNLWTDIIIQLTDSSLQRYDDIIYLLERENTPEANEVLAATYLEKDEPAMAENKINGLPDTKPEYIHYKNLYRILIDLQLQRKSIYEMDSMQRKIVKEIAYTCPPDLAVVNAGSIWKRLTGEDIPKCPQSDFGNRMEQVFTEDLSGTLSDNTDDDDLLGENYPDPCKTVTTIPYRLPKGFEGYIMVSNAKGQELFRYKALSGEHEIIINLGNYAAGLYYYSLEIKGLPILTKKIVKN